MALMYLFLSLFLLFPVVSHSEVTQVCKNWFKQLEIKKDQNCILNCSVAPTGMNTFMCTSKCKDLCKKDPSNNKKMNISKKGIDFIANYEGFSANKYYDIGGNATIGYGHFILEGENYSKPITKEKARDLLKKDIKFAIAAVNTSVKVPITQIEFDALVSLAFNIGVGAFKSSTLLKKINSGEPVTSRYFGMWNRVNGKTSRGLSKRRADEFELYKNGNYEITRCPRRGKQ